MTDRLRSLSGAGLAAPQIGASVRVVVIEVRKTDVFPDRPEHPLLQMVNPVIVNRSESTVVDWEGCFSVPGLMGLVARAETVTVEFLSSRGEHLVQEYTGYVARVIQHEVDHLDAIEFVDRIESMQSLTTVRITSTSNTASSTVIDVVRADAWRVLELVTRVQHTGNLDRIAAVTARGWGHRRHVRSHLAT